MDRRVQPRLIFQAVLNDETFADVQSVHWDARPHTVVQLTIVQKKGEDTITYEHLWQSGDELLIKGARVHHDD